MRRRRPAVACASALLTLAACASPRSAPSLSPAASPPSAVALLPLDDATGADAPVARLGARLAAALRARGIDVVAGERVERLAQSHGIRWTDGLDRETANTVRDELGVRGALVGTVSLYGVEVPRLVLTLRLVDLGDKSIRWIDGVAITGDDAPGLLGAGRVGAIEPLEDRALRELAASLARRLDGDGARAHACDGRRYAPLTAFRSPRLGSIRGRTIAVLPFRADRTWREAGRIVALEFVRQLAAVEGVTVVEPGIVQTALRRFTDAGFSLDDASLAFDTIHADLILSGEVTQFEDGAGGSPRVSFKAHVLDRSSDKVVWDSISFGAGDQGVWLFGMGRVHTASEVTCRLAASVVGGIAQGAR
ncbi:MAG TPA: hypothetical protein VM753_21765 [Anaeromyxobacter sp.]|jgi:hypothetical protein|nr:hypothetical protein [Anaeromyxobacter sp.]